MSLYKRATSYPKIVKVSYYFLDDHGTDTYYGFYSIKDKATENKVDRYHSLVLSWINKTPDYYTKQLIDKLKTIAKVFYDIREGDQFEMSEELNAFTDNLDVIEGVDKWEFGEEYTIEW